jgi:hypothetical protein
MTFDVRLVLALPDYSTPQGKKGSEDAVHGAQPRNPRIEASLGCPVRGSAVEGAGHTTISALTMSRTPTDANRFKMTRV